jgi:hypothetical protein
MLYYPQLTTGAIAQFPVTRNVNMRTVANQLPSGVTIRMADVGCQKVQWKLRYSGLTNAERNAIEDLFESSAGQLNTFTFLDPMDNLLTWSEDWTNALWTADPLLQVTTGVQDPFGNQSAMQLTNTGAAAQQIAQNTSGPSNFVYCFSVYVRSNTPTTVQLLMSATGQTLMTPFSATASWQRAIVSGSLSVEQDGISFGVQLPVGAQVDAFGAQVEAQAEAGMYKKTIDLGGVYSNTRFSSDLLTFSATAVNQNSCQLMLISNLN